MDLVNDVTLTFPYIHINLSNEKNHFAFKSTEFVHFSFKCGNKENAGDMQI